MSTAETSAEAFETIKPVLNRIQADVYAWFQSAKEATDAELKNGLNYLYSNETTLRVRRIELVQKGLLQNSGKVRKNAANKNMIVWELVQ